MLKVAKLNIRPTSYVLLLDVNIVLTQLWTGLFRAGIREGILRPAPQKKTMSISAMTT